MSSGLDSVRKRLTDNVVGSEESAFLMIVGLLSVLTVSANAGIWTHTPTYGGGWTSTYMPTYNWSTNSFN